MDPSVETFLAVTGTTDEAIAQLYLEMSGGNLDSAVAIFLENPPAPSAPDDAEVARQLQQEAYSDTANVREADALVHRHDTLVDSFGFGGGMFGGGSGAMFGGGARDMFGQGQVGVFNQRMDEDENDYYQNRFNVLLEPLDLEEEEPVTSTQQRLAQLFRPPFDLITVALLDEARSMGREDKKWILINIQDPLVFQSQVMNRDFWSNREVKQIVQENFVFLQYQQDLANGESYVNFYNIDEPPHVAILDPWTGERLKSWEDGVVPDIDAWVTDVETFLEGFSLNPESLNPIVTHEPKFDPNSLTEEQQVEYAMKQSMQGATKETAIAIDDESGAVEETVEAEEETDPFDAIPAEDHLEPASGPRIQFRFPNGKRLIHRFNDSDTVTTIFSWLKTVVGEDVGIGGRFTITNPTNRGWVFLENLATAVSDAGLNNALVLVENE